MAAGIPGAVAAVVADANLGSGSPLPPSTPPGSTQHRATDDRRDFWDRWTNKLFAIDTASRLASAISTALPTTIHQITVSVAGGPYARIERIWQLCVAAAFGKYREGPNFNFLMSTNQYQGVWDITAKVVSFRIVSESSGLPGQIPYRALGKSPRSRADTGLGYLMLGPSQETAGGAGPEIFDTAAKGSKTRLIGGYPITKGFSLPDDRDVVDKEASEALPDDGRMITSWYRFDPKFQNPDPYSERGDGGRVSLVSLVSAALTNEPGYFPAKPPELDTAPFSVMDSRLYPADKTEPSNIRDKIRKFARGLFTTLLGKSWDGYQPIPQNRGPSTSSFTTLTTGGIPLPGANNNQERFGTSEYPRPGTQVK